MRKTPIAKIRPYNGPTFGMVLRGYRLGWCHSKAHGAFIRLTCPDDRSYVTVHLWPRESLVPAKNADNNYLQWWAQKPSLVDMIPALNTIIRVKKYIKFDVDQNGRRIL